MFATAPHQPVIGYCTNVHAGTDLKSVQANLERFSLVVKKNVRPNQPMGIGLWLSHEASHDLLDGEQLPRFADWMNAQQLTPFTFNGFPYSNFHQPVVKHDVYFPTWADSQRFDYTLNLARIQAQLLKAQSDQHGFATISTLPLGWPAKKNQNLSFKQESAKRLIEMSIELEKLQETTGIQIMLCIEPEPGCIIDTADDVCTFFEQYLSTGNSKQTERVRRYIGICHDICHSSVMYEPQSSAMDQFHAHEIAVGKFQISSAVEADFDRCPSKDARDALLAQLREFREPRYLHQTSIQLQDGSRIFYEDLSYALDSAGKEPQGKWRVHFHVPLFAETLDLVGTTQRDVQSCLDSIKIPVERPLHFELETYAWTVLPDSLTVPLADGISKEFKWFEKKIGA